jgi:hypothetical protein
MATITRAEHLAWCKQRALEYVDAGDVQGAFNSMASDMRKHPETANTDVQMLGLMLMMNGHLDDPAKMRRWIEGFN